jgi:hypothetical protein
VRKALRSSRLAELHHLSSLSSSNPLGTHVLKKKIRVRKVLRSSSELLTSLTTKMVNPVFVDIGNYLWEIDVDSKDTGLIRQNAMTLYETMTPYLILARDFSTNNRLFFSVKVKNYPGDWIKIDLKQGDNILKN